MSDSPISLNPWMRGALEQQGYDPDDVERRYRESQERGHDYGRDCWCNPLVVTVGVALIAPEDGTIARLDPIGADQVAAHFERRED